MTNTALPQWLDNNGTLPKWLNPDALPADGLVALIAAASASFTEVEERIQQFIDAFGDALEKYQFCTSHTGYPDEVSEEIDKLTFYDDLHTRMMAAGDALEAAIGTKFADPVAGREAQR